MKIIKFIIIIYFYAVCTASAAIDNYQLSFGICFPNGNNGSFRISLRKYFSDNCEYLLNIDPHNLNTFIEKTSSMEKIEKSSFEEIRGKYRNTKYIKAIIKSEKRAAFLQNAGIIHFPNINNGAVLTADLCPSRLPVDRNFFTIIIDEFKKSVPVALSVSGLWIENHKDDLKWIKSLEEKYMISVTWINHSYNHRFSENTHLNNNFLLLRHTNTDKEVLETEKKMLETGIVPSVFFRFPGLVSNRDLFFKITGYGLIPVGSDAWLAKDERPGDGSIILVHANGNEPEGILRLKELIIKKRNNKVNKRWNLFDIKESMAGVKQNNN